MKIPEFSIEHRLISSWLNDFDYTSYEINKSERIMFEASGQNPYGVARLDFEVEVLIRDIGKRVYVIRFARAGESLKFHPVYERLKEV